MVCMWLTLVPLEAQELEDDDLSLEMERLKKIAHILREIWFALAEQVGEVRKMKLELDLECESVREGDEGVGE